ncbi:DHA2 family efflux MFS transporter permease subunit [Streptacidiphilus fuscans]|uniref:DHA2 family efflux MFS transporter permease subunit n=1 Tax=Streptacidiphilus fuscans TaxID=2789292 RepID=A0A931B2B8_9ACTN|nr:DHA2 family efflux MFS transporter permease subunit [Streptacidiphilus fuscans]MBF9067957.1 DHA2 family efflux MFS transporter permease subunit [Streptacidiphilus fuscans]
MASNPTARKGRPAVWAFVITSTAGFMAALDNLVVTTALPSIRAHLGGGITDLEWTVNAYTLTFAVLLMLGAALGDRFGRRRLFIIGLGLFTVSSLAASLAPSIDVLVAARAAQGVGAALLMPVSLTLLTSAVPAARRGVAFGAWGAVNGMAVAMGPLIGGAVVQHLSWQWIFALNVPIGLLLLPLARLRLTESFGPNSRLDVTGTALASAGLFGIVYGLIRGNSDGWTSVPVLSGLVGGAVLLVGFIVWESRAAHPLLPLRLFRNRTFAAVNAASMLMSLGMFGAIFLLSQYLQNVQGYSPMGAGVRMLPWTGMPMIVAPLAGLLVDRIGGRTVIAVGLALQAIGLGWFAAIAAAHISYASQVPGLVISGTGMALFFAPVAAMLMGSVKPEEQGVASGTNNALREVGGALGVAVLTSVFTARGSYASGQSFVDGLIPALWVGAAVVAMAVVAILIAPRRSRTVQGQPVAAGGAVTDASADGPVGAVTDGSAEGPVGPSAGPSTQTPEPVA